MTDSPTPDTRSARRQALIARLDKGGHLSEAERILLLEAQQICTRLEEAPTEFSVTSIVSQRTGEGKVDMTFHGSLAQLATVKAREMAWMLLECASVSEAESMLVRFLREELKVEGPRASQLLSMFRSYREQDPASLLVQGDGKTPIN
jgi:hypothetical protein